MTINEIVDLTQSLIRFKSVASRPEQIRECAAFIGSYLDQHGIAYQRLDHNGIPGIAALPRPDFAPVLLMAHFDVVAGSDRVFEPYIKEGRLYGRGSVDDKYAVALSMVMLKDGVRRLVDQGKGQADLPFGILLTGDEEVGGYNGARHALTRLRTDFCIALDGGRPDRIVVKEKGFMRLKLTARGKAAHGARPWLGINAIARLVSDYQQIKKFFPEDRADHWQRTLNWGIVRAGESVNQVPDRAEALFDVRYTEEDDPAGLVAQMRSVIEGEIEIMELEPLFTSGESSYLDILQRIAPNAERVFEHGASDARFLSSRGVPGIVWGADSEMSTHSVDEHVVIESIRRLHDMLDAFMAEVAAR